MVSNDLQQGFGLPDLLGPTFGRIIEAGFLSKAELSILFQLIRNRRSLPVYHGDFWACYECSFTSETLGTIAMHIMRVHRPAPFSEEDLLEAAELEV
jgi:hypothetical protein